MAGKLVIGPEGFVDLRRNPESTTVTVQGHRVEKEAPRKIVVESMPEPPAEKREEVLPARQKTTEGLETSVAEPVKVKRQKKPVTLMRIASSSGHECYAVVTASQWKTQSRHAWIGSKNGLLYRMIKNYRGLDEPCWLHRILARCNRIDRYVGFRNNDERDLTAHNLVIFRSKEELKAHRLKGRQHG